MPPCDEPADDSASRCTSVHRAIYLILGAVIERESCMSTQLLIEINYATVTDGLIIFFKEKSYFVEICTFPFRGPHPRGNGGKLFHTGFHS